MDSGTSGSVQSSSGAEEEYDSRAEGFLNNPSLQAGPMPKPNPSLPPSLHSSATHHPHSSSSLFDPFFSFFDPLPSRSHQNSFLNLHTSWPRNPRSDHNPTQHLGSIPLSSSQPQSFMTTTADIQLQLPNQAATESNVVQASRGLTLTNNPTQVVHSNNDNNTGTNSNATVRNPRKRTRASRRAPTTVLTTDTSNFRAMVQEFTGIPAPPFQPASSSFTRARFDLFAGTSTSSPPYLLRPFPHKLSPFPTNSLTTATNSLLSPSSDFLLTKQNLNHHLPSMSSIFNLHPPPPPLQQPNINLLRSDLHVSLDSAQTITDTNRNPLHLPLPEELLSGNNLPANWGSSTIGGGGRPSDQDLLRSMDGKYCTGTNLNNSFSAPSSDFHGDKGSENVTTRSEGMIESWICSSD